MSICTPRACPGSGSHSEYGKPEPIISSVSQPCIIASLGFVPSRPIEPVTKDRSSGSTSRPLSALATPAPRRTASSSTSAAASRAPCPIRIATRSPRLSTSAARTRSACCGITRGLWHRPAGEDGAVGARRRLELLLLQVVRDDHAGDRAGRAGDLDRAVDQVRDLRGHRRHLDEVARDVLEQRDEVDLLLVAGAERHARLLAHDRDDRLVVELGVVEPVEEVDRARPGGRQADADVAAELGVRARHEGGELLVGGLDELDLLAVLVEAAEDPVDAVARDSRRRGGCRARAAVRGCVRRPSVTWRRRYPVGGRITRASSARSAASCSAASPRSAATTSR